MTEKINFGNCRSEGCSNPTRARDRYKNGVQSYEARCLSCQGLMKKYGLTAPERDAMLVAQNNKCLICNTKIFVIKHGHTARHAAVVDHCHSTGVVRGILCGQCNIGLGAYADDPNRMREAAKYLERKRYG